MDSSMQSARPDILTLRAIEGPTSGTTYTCNSAQASIGRTAASTVAVADNTVSEKHGQFFWSAEAKQWLFVDHDSSNGSALNLKNLDPHEPMALKNGDILRVGNTKLQVELKGLPGADCTVEEFLDTECQRLVHMVQAQAERHCNELLRTWEASKKSMLTAK